MIPRKDITGLILAGGQGTRMGGLDKGLQLLRGQPLVRRVLDAFAPQVSAILISANRNLPLYEALGHPVISDSLPDHPGPLAGFLSGLEHMKTDWLATAPCDTPGLPTDLVHLLVAAVSTSGGPMAVARTADGPQPVFMLCHRQLAAPLRSYLLEGGRRLQGWQRDMGAVWVDFPDQTAFANFNTLADLQD